MEVREKGMLFSCWELRSVLPQELFNYIELLRDYAMQFKLSIETGETIVVAGKKDRYGFTVEVELPNYPTYERIAELVSHCESVVKRATDEGLFDRLLIALYVLSVVSPIVEQCKQKL